MAYHAQQLVENLLRSPPISFEWKHKVTLLLATLYVWNCHDSIKTNVELRTKLNEASLFLLDDEARDDAHMTQSLHDKLAGYDICTTERGNMGFISSGSDVGDWIISCQGVFNSMLIRPQWYAEEDTCALIGETNISRCQNSSVELYQYTIS